MKYALTKGSHSVYALQYHFVQCVKYRRAALVEPELIALLKTKVQEISDSFGAAVLNIECDKDHFHMIFTGKPTLDLPRYINAIKTITSREIRRQHPNIRRLLWKDIFWSPSYFLTTTGQTTLDQLKQYVDNQGKH